MPPLPSAAGTIKLLLQYALPGVATILNRLFFTGTGSTTGAAMNTWCTNVANAWGTNMAPQCVPPLTLVAITAEDLTSATSPVGAWAGSKPGTNVANLQDPATAFVVKNLVANRYRGGHPRTYLPGIPIADASAASSNTWLTATASTILTQWLAFLTAISGSSGPTGYTGLSQSYVPYYKGNTVTTTGTAPYQRGHNHATVLTSTAPILIASHTYNPTFGSQRRRNHQSQ
jgi:hypothetical protein